MILLQSVLAKQVCRLHIGIDRGQAVANSPAFCFAYTYDDSRAN